MDTQEIERSGVGYKASHDYEKLTSVGKRYIEFMKAASDQDVTEEKVAAFFAPQCTKIENGTVLFTKSADLPIQLNGARKAVGTWKIETLLTLVDVEQQACTIQFWWKGERLGPHTTMVVLYVDPDGKISKICEVFNEYQKKTLGE